MIHEKLNKEYWMKQFKVNHKEIPEMLIIEGSWKIAQRTEERKKIFDAQEKDIWFKNIMFGKYKKFNMAYSCTYGASVASEVVYIFGSLGTPSIIQIGTCVVLQKEIEWVQISPTTLYDYPS